MHGYVEKKKTGAKSYYKSLKISRNGHSKPDNQNA